MVDFLLLSVEQSHDSLRNSASKLSLRKCDWSLHMHTTHNKVQGDNLQTLICILLAHLWTEQAIVRAVAKLTLTWPTSP